MQPTIEVMQLQAYGVKFHLELWFSSSCLYGMSSYFIGVDFLKELPLFTGDLRLANLLSIVNYAPIQ